MQRKKMIMEHALELFAEQGFNATSVQQITEHCGISKGAFYLSFRSKHELIYALIDQFMMEHTTKLDHLVKSSDNDEQNLLFKFYLASYEFFKDHASFAKFFIQEIQTFNDELIDKLSYYDRLQEKLILSMIERIYGEAVTISKYDLLFCIKAFMGMYAELIIYRNIPLDIERLAQSLVEKTSLLAEQMQTPLITHHHVQFLKIDRNKAATKDMLLKLLEEKIATVETSIEKESFVLLREHLEKNHLPNAVVKGLIENIRKHQTNKWIAFLLMDFLDI